MITEAIDGSELVGNGSTGNAYRYIKTDLVYKNATKAETDVYGILNGAYGICPGRLDGDKIVTPYYPLVISVDTINPENRAKLADVIAPNINRINAAVSALTGVGYEYSDPLQFGVNASGALDLLDFSNANNNFPDDVLRNNLSELARFYREFGLDVVGKAVSTVNEVLSNQHSRAKHPFIFDFLGDEFDGVDYRQIDNDLGGEPARYAYFRIKSEREREPDIAGTSKVSMSNGIEVFLSINPVSHVYAEKFGLTLVYSHHPV